jgi:hypothetical protein
MVSIFVILLAALNVQPTFAADTTAKTVRTQSIEKVSEGIYELYFHNVEDIPPFNTSLMVGASGKKLASFQIIGKPTELYTVKCRLIRAFEKESEWLGSQHLFAAYRIATPSSIASVNENTPQKQKPLRKISRSKSRDSYTRSKNPFGIDLCYGTAQPFGALFGGRLNYNISDLIRVGAGYGYAPLVLANISSIGGGIELFYPDWSVSPFVGVDYHVISGGVSTSLAALFPAASTDYSVLSFPFGVDWQTESGFHLAILFAAVSGTNGLGISTFSAQAGYYFGGAKNQSMDSVF